MPHACCDHSDRNSALPPALRVSHASHIHISPPLPALLPMTLPPPPLLQLNALVADAPPSDAHHFLAQKARDIIFLAESCIMHARPHQLNLVLSLAGLHQISSSSPIISSASPPLQHRAALLPVFNPSLMCTVLAHDDNVDAADDTGTASPHTGTSTTLPHALLGNTALIRACEAGKEKAALFLIDILRANPRNCNSHGCSPLHAACANGHVQLVDVLAGKAPDMLVAVDVEG